MLHPITEENCPTKYAFIVDNFRSCPLILSSGQNIIEAAGTNPFVILFNVIKSALLFL